MFRTRDKDALQKRIQGACKWRKWLRHARAFPVGLTTYGSLAIDDDRYVSNEIECLAHEYHDVFTIPCAFFSLAILLPLRPVSPIWIMRALEAARTTRGDACTVISKYISNDCRALELFHVPSTTHAALPGRTFNKNHGT